MKGSTHLSFGICTGIACAFLIQDYSLFEKTIFVGSCVLGSLIPDADIPTSLIGKHIKPISKIINNIFGHRTFLHSPLFYGFIYFIKHILKGVAVPPQCVLGFTIGFFGHLFLDTLTAGGVPWIYPFSKKRIRFSSIKTGSKAEPVLATIVFLLFVFVFYKNNLFRDYIHITFILRD